MKNLPWIILYTCINALFVYKYSVMVTPHPVVVTILYVAVVTAFLLFYLPRARGREDSPFSRARWLLIIGGLATTLFFAMRRLDPATLSVGRYPAFTQWIERFLNGDFPYGAPSRPSGLPFLFLVAVPFHCAGEIGLLHIAAFLVFSTVILREFASRSYRDGIHRVVILVSSPLFLYELAVRSDLFTNMVLVLLYAIAVDMATRRNPGPVRLLLLGIAGGCILATRLIVTLIYLLILTHYLRRHGLKSIWLILGILIGLGGIILPFVAWDPGSFLAKGPLAIQASYMSLTTALPVLLLAFILSLRPMSRSTFISRSAILLFVAVLLPFLASLHQARWDRVIFHDGFDISYFAFCLPFLILSFDTNGKNGVEKRGASPHG